MGPYEADRTENRVESDLGLHFLPRTCLSKYLPFETCSFLGAVLVSWLLVDSSTSIGDRSSWSKESSNIPITQDMSGRLSDGSIWVKIAF